MIDVVAGLDDMKSLRRSWKAGGKIIGFVPTMGYLHEGHLSLVRESKRQTDVTVVSIFVNPAQFGPAEDLDRYPRDMERDKRLLEKEKVDCLFLPHREAIYPTGYSTWVEIHGLQDGLCGRSRPGHFRGVSTVVLKLFNIVRPDKAFFGWKDAQQFVLLKRMVTDLDLEVTMEGMPTVREPDGLAMSSRNTYLSPEERQAALVIPRSLEAAEDLVRGGERRAEKVLETIKKTINGEALARLDYAELVDLWSLEPLSVIKGEVLMAVAVYIGKTRLIDNIRLKV